MNKITLQIIKNNLPISDVCRTVAIDKVDKNGKVTTCEIDNPVYKWYNKDTKKWYFGDRWSQQCNFSPTPRSIAVESIISQIFLEITK